MMLVSTVSARTEDPTKQDSQAPPQAAERLAGQLKRHPPGISNVDDPLRLYMLDLVGRAG